MPYSEKQIAEWAAKVALAMPWEIIAGQTREETLVQAARTLIAAVRKETREECEKDSQDAKRYRWLRKIPSGSISNRTLYDHVDLIDERLLVAAIKKVWLKQGDWLDSAIDAALRSRPAQGELGVVNWTTEGCTKHHGQPWSFTTTAYTAIGKRCPLCEPHDAALSQQESVAKLKQGES